MNFGFSYLANEVSLTFENHSVVAVGKVCTQCHSTLTLGEVSSATQSNCFERSA